MTTSSRVPSFVRLGNLLTGTLLRVGIKIAAPQNTPAYLLTVRGRKSGQPRTTPIVVVELEGERYLLAPFGEVDWVRNLRAAGEATLTRGRHTEAVRASELPGSEAGLVLKGGLEAGKIPSVLLKYFEITTASSREELEEATTRHPVFLLRRPA